MALKWSDVFKKAILMAKDIRKKNPNLSYAQAVKKAWATPEIKKLADEYRKKKGASEKKEGGRARGRPRGAKARKSARPAKKRVAPRKAARKPRRK